MTFRGHRYSACMKQIEINLEKQIYWPNCGAYCMADTHALVESKQSVISGINPFFTRDDSSRSSTPFAKNIITRQVLWLSFSSKLCRPFCRAAFHSAPGLPAVHPFAICCRSVPRADIPASLCRLRRLHRRPQCETAGQGQRKKRRNRCSVRKRLVCGRVRKTQWLTLHSFVLAECSAVYC